MYLNYTEENDYNNILRKIFDNFQNILSSSKINKKKRKVIFYNIIKNNILLT